VRRNTIDTGKYDHLETVIERCIAKKARVESKGILRYTESQWKNKMLECGASMTEATTCWEQSTDRFGTKYKTEIVRKTPYLLSTQVAASTYEKRCEQHTVRPGRDRQITSSEADAMFGTTEASRGGRSRSTTLRRSNARTDLDEEAEDEVGDSRSRTREPFAPLEDDDFDDMCGMMLDDASPPPPKTIKEPRSASSEKPGTKVEDSTALDDSDDDINHQFDITEASEKTKARWTPPVSCKKRTIEELSKIIVTRKRDVINTTGRV